MHSLAERSETGMVVAWDSANEIVNLIADVVSIFDEICRRYMNFISTCYQLGSELVSYVINRGS